MILKHLKKKSIPVILFVVFAGAGFVSAEEKIINIKFARPPVSDSDAQRTLRSLVKVRDISETYSTGGLYLLTHYGDREDLFKKQNQKEMDNPLIHQTWRYCSLFATSTENNVLMGRNWDNQNVGSIIVSLNQSPKGYASISFCRAIDMGFPLNVGLEDFIQSPLGERLLLAPFYAMDGINEHGLTVAVSGVNTTTVKPKSGRELVAISFLIRKILDQTKNIEEAVRLVDQYVPFLLDKNTLAGHLLVADAAGKSVVLEYVEDEWRKIYGDKSWQALTNRPVYNVTEETLRAKCWRYRSISETLEKTKDNMDWKSGLKILQDVTQKGTTWSVIYSPSSGELYFSVYQNWDKIYHLKTFQPTG
ncbi:MAG: linear amide C-N hydrolase [Candidatus Aminicenantes bacterium]|nr:linear amide C-N hydrolase [Candidatus Aminicenantes bacterium]